MTHRIIGLLVTLSFLMMALVATAQPQANVPEDRMARIWFSSLRRQPPTLALLSRSTRTWLGGGPQRRH
jgi:hypothetical protein